MRFRIAASAGVLALAATSSLFSAGSASALATGGGCRAPYYADGVNTQACITYDGGNNIHAAAYTGDAVHNTIDLCIKIVNSGGGQMGPTTCRQVDAYYGSVVGPSITAPPGNYYGVAWFTSPTYYYAGESPAVNVS
ncbi:MULTISPECIES: hypothetical protein [Kitasatospora]|uniref:hypothetical protein n=1 Tax=Kitasatospora TaxID=2063 RepID=UPI000CC3C7D6|nr:hypothetical protein [Kitasatospora sp. GP30]MDH6139348.1 hypothetical protein [Kitasatospora sp. GP30]